MNRKRNFMVFITLFVTVVFLLTGCKSISSIQEPLSEPITEIDPQMVEPTEEVIPSIPDPATLLNKMVHDFEEQTFTQSGWLHYKCAYKSDLENENVLPDGSLMPNEYVWESWYLVNENGYVTESVTSFLDTEGNIIQQFIFTNGTEYNLTFNNSYDTQSEQFKLSLEFNLAKMMLDEYDRGLTLSASVDDIDGRSVIRFSSGHRYDVLNYISESSQPVQRTNKELILDRTSGQLLESKTFFILEDGTEELSQHQYDCTIDWVELPEELEQLIENVEN